ncbi:MAG TPA: hypothetical protein VE978_25560 [Chitinophagales bacterium]|nr:hypothetical protein [Chitinophagales bacterium]
MEEGKKYPIIPLSNPMVAGYSLQLDQHLKSDNKRIIIEVPRPAILSSEVSTVANLLAVVQHKKKWIDAFLFGIDFSFLPDHKSPVKSLPVEEWASDPDYQRWFYTLGIKLPFALFFLRNEHARMFAIHGDFMQELLEQQNNQQQGKYLVVEVPTEKEKLINSRTYYSCLTFYSYCSGMRIDAKPYIESIIAEMDCNFTFKQMKKDWLANEYLMVPGGGR